jgi:formylglycine-generating enzyme required for sulfatase activity
MRSSVGRAELLLSLAATADCDLDRVAAVLGYERQQPTELVQRILEPPPDRPEKELAAHPKGDSQQQQVISVQPTPVPFWRPVGYQVDVAGPQPDSATPGKLWRGLASRPPEPQPLCPLPALMPRLRRALASKVPGGALDLSAAIRWIGRGDSLRRWPKRRRLCWPQKLHVMQDFAPRLMPLWRDQKQVTLDIGRYITKYGIRRTRLQDGLWHGTWHGELPEQGDTSDHGAVILVISDLGCLEAKPEASFYRWEQFALACRAARTRCIALTPVSPAAYPASIRRAWTLVPWERNTYRLPANPADRENQARRLLALLSHAVKIPPGLMREVRRRHFSDASVVAEIDLWRLPEIDFVHPDGALLRDDARSGLHELFRDIDAVCTMSRRVFNSLKAWCGGEHHSIYLEAVISLGRLADAIVESDDVRAALDLLADMSTIVNGETLPQDLHGVSVVRVKRYAEEMRARTHDAATDNPLWGDVYSRLLVAVQHGSTMNASFPRGFNPAALGGERPQRCQRLIQRNGSIYAVPVEAPHLSTNPSGSDSSYHSMSPLADITTRNGVFAIWETLFWRAGSAPSWASDWGTDAFGPWVEFTITDAEGGTIRQRMRWMPPGRFMMGSPENEPGRYSDEGPRHEVLLSCGYWLFDTPVTQALWGAVMGGNPSHFVHPARPVEQVSWNDAVAFLRKINARVPNLDLVLPTEAQWEYACRAGTDTATYVGAMEILGENNAPILDAIAWYSGNSGVDFDLPYGIDSSSWAEKQHEHGRAGTRPVGLKKPNAWGLHDMLGNVWEWCADELRDYEAGLATDPVGERAVVQRSYNDQFWSLVAHPLEGSSPLDQESSDSVQPALHGGSWLFNARGVRAAYRYQDVRDRRSVNIGFRCARVREGAEPTERGPSRAERQPAPARSGEAKLFSFDGGRGEPMAPLPKGRGFVVRSDCETLIFEPVSRPDWASAMGRDRWGLWMEFTLGEVTQRMRWIPPGRFPMGSPENEPGRDGQQSGSWNEGPQHEVTLTKGYWLFDTPVTQALWLAVMHSDPSKFKGPLRPVEQVSWNDAATFMERINAAVLEMDLVLPTEAQWEYACRAGREGMNYYQGEAGLKRIAWFQENSGGETRPVAHLRRNDWGLYDMLGNIWEWCADDLRTYGADPIADPIGAQDSAQRAVRGGAWGNVARSVRAASRRASHRENLGSNIGFRCARVRP